MAITDAGSTPLTFTNLPIGVQVTKVTDNSGDFASLANSTYFYNKADGLTYFKNSSGTVLSLFSASGTATFTEAENTAAPNATVPVDSLTATGSATNIDVALVPKGTGSVLAQVPDNTATSGNKRGINSVDLQTSRLNANEVASGQYATISGGRYNRASGDYSFTAGASNISSGSYSVSLGNSNTSSNLFSIALGQACFVSGVSSIGMGDSCTANGDFSMALGRHASVFSIIGRQAYASGQEASIGDSQVSKFVLRERTTGNTATTLTTNSSAAGTNNQVVLSNNATYRFKGVIVGRQSGSTNTAAWDIEGLIVRGTSAATTVLNVSTVTLVQNSPAWGTPTLAADTTNGCLQVQVTGAAATNIQWVCRIETTEVIYA